MFKKIINTKGFWRSVFSLGLAFMFIFFIIKWIIEGFSASFVTEGDSLTFLGGLAGASMIYGFFVTYGKFYKRIKSDELKK